MRRWRWVPGLVAWVLLGCMLCAVDGRAQSVAPSDVTRRPLTAPLTFVDGRGRAVSTDDFKGKWLLLYFGYMHCADLCPLGLTVMGQALDQIAGAGTFVQPLFVTVDPERDHGAHLAAFSGSFHERLIGLTGSEAQIQAAADAVGVVVRKAGSGDDATIDHSSSYSLIDPQRATVVTFKHAEAHLVAGRIVTTMEKGGTDLRGIAGIGAFR